MDSTQYVYDSVSSILHCLSHSVHALSDLMTDFSQPPDTRRLRAPTSVLVEQSTVLRATIPFPPAGLAAAVAAANQQQQQQQQQSSATANATPGGNSGNTTQQANQTSQQQSQSGQPRAAQPQQQQQPQFPMFPGLGAGNFGQVFSQAAAAAAAAATGAGASGGGGASFTLPPELGNLFGGNIAANMLNLAQASAQAGLQANAANANVSASASGGRTQPPPSTTASGASQPNTTQPTANQQQTGQRGSIDFPSPSRPFDVILQCHSHHNAQRRRQRPLNFLRHVQVGGGAEQGRPGEIRSPSQDILVSMLDFVRNSNVLPLLQPLLRDMITGYLMRGRDVNNAAHIKSCAKSIGKAIVMALVKFAVS